MPGTSNWPTSYDNYGEDWDDTAPNRDIGADVDDHGAAINNLQSELGLSPSGSLATVQEALAGAGITDPGAGGYTLVLADAGKVVTHDSDVTVPPNASVAFPVGTIVSVINTSASAIDIVPGSGVTINAVDGNLAISDQYAHVNLLKTATNTWYLLAAVGGGSAPAAVTRARVYRSTSQTITHNTETDISFDSEHYDDGGFWSAGNPTRLTIPNTGLYHIGATLQWNYSSVGLWRRISIQSSSLGPLAIVNASPIIDATNTPPFRQVISTQRELTAADWVVLKVWHWNSSGSATNDIPRVAHNSPEFYISGPH